MDRELKKMTAENRPEWEIEDYVVKTQGMRTMREELADLVCAGVISMEEFLRTVEKGRTCAACPVFFDIGKCL